MIQEAHFPSRHRGYRGAPVWLVWVLLLWQADYEGDPVGSAGPWYQALSHAEAAGWQGWVIGQQVVEP